MKRVAILLSSLFLVLAGVSLGLFGRAALRADPNVYTQASRGMYGREVKTVPVSADHGSDQVLYFEDPTATAMLEPTALGDVNADGLVDSTDALIVLSADAAMNTSQFCPMNCGDTNADGPVDSTDALIILSYDAQMAVPFPVGQPGCPASVTQPPGCSVSWMPTNWPASSDFFSLYTSQDRVFARTWDSLSGGRLFLTADDGASWTLIGSADSDTDILSIVLLDSGILAGTWDGLYLSTDGGTTWNAAALDGIPTDTAIWSLAVVDTSLFAGTTGHVYQSPDNGNTWTELGSGMPVDARITSMVATADAVFAGSAGNGVFKMTDGGTSWTAVNSGLTDLHISQLAPIAARLFAVALSGLYISDDVGTTWTADSSGLGNINCLVAANDRLYAGTDVSGVYLSADGGATWTPFNSGLPANTRVWSLAASSGYIFAGTDSGVWRTPLSIAL